MFLLKNKKTPEVEKISIYDINRPGMDRKQAESKPISPMERFDCISSHIGCQHSPAHIVLLPWNSESTIECRRVSGHQSKQIHPDLSRKCWNLFILCCPPAQPIKTFKRPPLSTSHEVHSCNLHQNFADALPLLTLLSGYVLCRLTLRVHYMKARRWNVMHLAGTRYSNALCFLENKGFTEWG